MIDEEEIMDPGNKRIRETAPEIPAAKKVIPEIKNVRSVGRIFSGKITAKRSEEN